MASCVHPSTTVARRAEARRVPTSNVGVLDGIIMDLVDSNPVFHSISEGSKASLGEKRE